jgi:glycoprotein-N-acetylgalactosamine 3-beta-galactosyltransferase
LSLNDKGDKCGYGPNGPRILCVVLTYPKNYKTKAKAVAETWGPRCDKFYFATGANKSETPQEIADKMNFIYLNASNNYNELSGKMFKLFNYVYDNLLDEFDWFLKADDDTYAIIENLKYLLANKCQNDKHSYGITSEKIST